MNIDKLYSDLTYIVLFMTQDCNLRCTYCFNELSEREIPPDFDVSDEGLKIFSDFINKCKSPQIEILFYGGEPLTRWENCKKVQDVLIRDCPSKTFMFKIQTNATLLTDKLIDEIKSRDNMIFISIDGDINRHNQHRVYPNGKGSWESVLAAINRLKAKGVPFNVYNVADDEINLAKDVIGIFDLGAGMIRTMIPSRCSDPTPFNFDPLRLENEFKQIVDYLMKNPSKKYMNFGNFSLNNQQELQKVYATYLKNDPTRCCFSFNGRVYLNSNGDFLSCSAMIDRKHAWANIYELDKGISSKYKFFEHLNLPECNSCPSKTGCRRCPYRAWQNTGSFYKCDDSTRDFSEVMTRVLDYLFEEAKKYGYLK